MKTLPFDPNQLHLDVPEDLVPKPPEYREVPVTGHTRKIPVRPPGTALDEEAKARKKGKATSKKAAAKVTDRGGLRGYQVFILEEFRRRESEDPGGLIDHGLYAAAAREGMHFTEQGIRSARVALVRKGLLADSGATRQTPYGNEAVVWVLTDAGRAFEVPS